MFRNCQETNNKQNGKHAVKTPEVQCATTEPLHQEPGGHCSDGADGVLGHIHVESVDFCETGLFVELGRGAHDA